MNKEEVFSRQELEYELCGGDPYEKGVGAFEQARRLRALADIREGQAKQLREQACAIEKNSFIDGLVDDLKTKASSL